MEGDYQLVLVEVIDGTLTVAALESERESGGDVGHSVVSR